MNNQEPSSRPLESLRYNETVELTIPGMKPWRHPEGFMVYPLPHDHKVLAIVKSQYVELSDGTSIQTCIEPKSK